MINKLLYSLSYTDQELIAHCDARSRTQQKLKGVLVLIVGIFATFSAIDAMSLMTRSLFLIIVSGVAYGLILVFFYRYIVSATTKHVALLGLLFAIIFGINTSVPLELRVFERRIDEEISKRQMTEKEMRIREIENEIEQSKKALETLQKELIAEASGKGGSGKLGEGYVYRQKLKVYEDFRSQTEQRITQLMIEIDRIRNEQDTLSLNHSEDFLLRLEASQEIQKTSPSALRAIWTIRSMFILTYAMPFLFVLLEANTKYTFLVKKRQANISQYEPKYLVAAPANSRVSIPNFGHGFATAIDWTGMLAPTVEELRGGGETQDEADAAAFAGDWKAIGDDIRKVLNKHGAKAN